MSNENDQPKNNSAWDDEDEAETPRTYHDAYLNALNQNRPQPRSSETPQEPPRRTRPRGVPGSARIYEENESDDRPSRARPTRQSRENVEARLRQRQRQPVYARDREEPRARPPAQARKQPRREEMDVYPTRQPSQARSPRPAPGTSSRANQRATRPYEEYDEYDEYEIFEESRRRPSQQHRHKRGSGRSALSTLFTGCLGGLLTLIVVAAVVIFLIIHNTPLGQNLGIGKSTFKQSGHQTITLGSATQLIVRNQAGNIAVTIDPNATTASLSSIKQVQATGQDDANNQFKRIVLTTNSISQGADPACAASDCVLVTTAVPTTGGSGSLFGSGNGTSIDLVITLPGSFNSPDPATPNTITANANAGDINVSSFNGILSLNSTAGDIKVAHTLIFASTCIQTLHGDITVGQGSIFDLASASKRVPCSNTTSNDPHPWFNIKSGVGNVDIALTTNLTNLLLDANTNNGKITDDFNLNISANSDGSASYHGSLLPNTSPRASLYVATSTGNITLRKE